MGRLDALEEDTGRPQLARCHAPRLIFAFAHGLRVVHRQEDAHLVIGLVSLGWREADLAPDGEAIII